MPTTLTPEQFLAGFPPPIQALAHRLRTLIKRVLPESTEQVRLGWQLIGLYVPARGRKPVYMGFLIPHTDYLTLGFEYGILLDDPAGLLLGGSSPEERLKQVRYLTFRQAGDLRVRVVTPYLRQAAEVALMPNDLRRQLLAAAQEGQGAKRPRRSAL
jgi:hypothetical protein